MSFALVMLLASCSRSPESHQQPAPAPATPAPIDAAAAEPSAAVVEDLDAMLAEVDQAWRADQTTILVPKARPGIRVTDDNGVAVLIPSAEIPISEMQKRLAKRNVKNTGLKMYTDGSLVTLDSSGAKASQEPVVLALNETLLVFLVPSKTNPASLTRLEVAMP